MSLQDKILSVAVLLFGAFIIAGLFTYDWRYFVAGAIAFLVVGTISASADKSREKSDER